VARLPAVATQAKLLRRWRLSRDSGLGYALFAGSLCGLKLTWQKCGCYHSHRERRILCCFPKHSHNPDNNLNCHPNVTLTPIQEMNCK